MKSAAIDLSRHISLQIGALKLFEIWFYIPHNMKDVRFWVCIWTRIVLGIAVFVIPTGSQLIYAVRLIMSGNAEIQEVAGIINLVLTELLVSLRLLDLSLRRHLLSQLAEQLKGEEFQFHSPAQKRILEKAVESSRRLFWILLCSCSSDVLVHVVVVPALHNFQTLPLKMDLVYLDVDKESYFNYLCAYQSMHVSTVIFSCPWIELPTTVKKNLVIFIAKTQRPLVITAAKLVPVSLETFTKLVSTLPNL
ncbi:unnamed protein product [Spodoptera littoralis]|uniref:Odorant receptor n=1 Tax=Spodoptera littoralis TaxID=7109 RepID=A0A9P0HZ79_SPOLI|nr:unnamed protein product [Spodoptera littoralis]CAH1637268.1 unnamed protein product [Spodoptera littoralis]